MKHIVAVIFLGLFGLVIGYLVFGNIDGKFIVPNEIFGASKADDVTDEYITALDKVQGKIMTSAAVGAIIGLFLSMIKRKENN
ncbi:MAG: hypothetical protein K9M99_02010 [Candidatus Cloacimonetes bacterium]|nr:hypothetical protein [Candidatus Cloacimonadota bacterium]